MKRLATLLLFGAACTACALGGEKVKFKEFCAPGLPGADGVAMLAPTVIEEQPGWDLALSIADFDPNSDYHVGVFIGLPGEDIFGVFPPITFTTNPAGNGHLHAFVVDPSFGEFPVTRVEVYSGSYDPEQAGGESPVAVSGACP